MVFLIIQVAFPHAGRAGAVGEEEVINDELIKVFADKGADFTQRGAHAGMIVAEGIKHTRLGILAFGCGDDGGQSPGHFHAMGMKHIADHLDLFM